MSTARGHMLVVATLVCGAAIGTAIFLPVVSAHHGSAVTEPTDAQRVVIAAASIEPDSLAAAGVGSGSAAAVAENALDHLAGTDTALAADYALLVLLRGQVLATERAVQSGKGSAQELAQLRTQLASEESSIAARLASLRTAAFAGLTNEQRDRLESLRTAQPLGLGYPYRAMDGSENERVALRGALANVRTCEFAGVNPDGACQAAVTAAGQSSGVATAASGLANLAAVRDAFATGMAG